MSNDKIYKVPSSIGSAAHIDQKKYQKMYQESINDPEEFWSTQAKEFVSWYSSWDKILDWDYHKAKIKWFDGAKLNVSYNCIDRHLGARGDQTAIIWEGDDKDTHEHITYKELHQKVCKFANALKKRNVKKGDRVCIYMPMVPEAAIAMLACTRIGAVHSVVFGGFSPDSLRDRILDSDCQTVITADQGVRGGKFVPLKSNTDQALQACPNVSTVVVIKRTGAEIDWNASRDCWYHEIVSDESTECEPEIMNAEDPLFILYTSGSTGKPKGVLHTTGGYLVYAAMTHMLENHVFQ